MTAGTSSPPLPALLRLLWATGGGTPANGTFATDQATPAATTVIKIPFVTNGIDYTTFWESFPKGTSNTTLINLILTDANGTASILACGDYGQMSGFIEMAVAANGASSNNWKGMYQLSFCPFGQEPLLFNPGWPTSDPHVVGQIWTNLGIVTVSAG